MRVHQMWNAYPDLKVELSMVLNLIDTHIRVRDKTVEATIKGLLHSGGKLLRPAYSLLCSQIGPTKEKEKAIAVAAALESLHMATLVHDDVIDQSEIRHGRETIQAQHGKHFAVYSGDYLFCVCFSLLSRYATSLAHLEFNSRSMEKILSGELDQLNSRFQTNVSVKNYLSRISGKTARLFALSCYSGAIESEASHYEAMRAWNMGHYIGMAFQIMDDILDYSSTMQSLGKPIMADIRQGIYTLPFIYSFRENPNAFLPFLQKKESLTEDDLLQIKALISQHNGLQKAQNLAERYTQKAIDEINKLPDGSYKITLFDLTKTLLQRSA